jgi:hypothetical protein
MVGKGAAAARIGDNAMTTTKKNPTKRSKLKSAAAHDKEPPAPQTKTSRPIPNAKLKGSPATKAAKRAAAPKKIGALDAAAKVLAEANPALTTGEMIERMSAKGYWTSPGGQTPAATLYSAILRLLKSKGTAARFAKADRGKFILKK